MENSYRVCRLSAVDHGPLSAWRGPVSACRTPGLTGACLFLLAVLGAAQRAVPPDTGNRIPGAIPGTERWIVHLADRSFDLSELRGAYRQKRPAAEIDAIIAGLERRAAADQAPLARAVGALGGRVRHHWWLINAAAVDIPPAACAALAARSDVRRLEPEDHGHLASNRSINRYNHNAVAAHRLGYKGRGVAIAIMDSGADADMGGTGRPHALYYPGGDPSNQTGGGIGGSRLVTCQQFGALPCEEQLPPHGTAVAAIAAGADWGAQGASDGQAPEARVAVYAMFDTLSSATTSSILQAWQAVVADVAKYNIVSVNNSWGGGRWASPTLPVQQALDAAVLCTDVTVVVSSQNAGAGARGGQAALNGIAVGAVEPDSHFVVDYSGRGPQNFLPTRIYPHMTACTHSLVGTPDCESGVEGFGGTSNAAPQVAGAVAVVRAANPALRADETRAIMLASALDISAKNPDPPYNTPNAYGVGLLRTDAALTTALDPSLHTRGQLGNTGQVWQFPFSVVQGRKYSVAISWLREDVAVNDWSNLELRITDGTQVVGSSDLPKNLYEIVRFTAASTGTFTAEVRSSYLLANPQEFGLAISEQITPPDESGAYLSFGDPCRGSGLGANVCLSLNPNALRSQLADWKYGASAVEWCFVLPALTQASSITGIELLGHMMETAPQSPVTIGLLSVDPSGMPRTAPLATAPMPLAEQPGWSRAVFPMPYQAAAGETLAVSMTAPVSYGFDLNTAATRAPWFVRWPGCASPWVSGGSYAAAVRVLCGPGSRGAEPLLTATGVPTLGASFQVHIDRALANSAAVLFTGASKTAWLGSSLPIKLGLIGGGSCALLVSGELQSGVPLDGTGHATLPLFVPSVSAFVGRSVYQQWLVLDPGANPLGLSVSGGGLARIGVP